MVSCQKMHQNNRLIKRRIHFTNCAMARSMLRSFVWWIIANGRERGPYALFRMSTKPLTHEKHAAYFNKHCEKHFTLSVLLKMSKRFKSRIRVILLFGKCHKWSEYTNWSLLLMEHFLIYFKHQQKTSASRERLKNTSMIKKERNWCFCEATTTVNVFVN